MTGQTLRRNQSLNTTLPQHKVLAHITATYDEVGVAGIDKYSTSIFFEKILRYYYIPTIEVGDLQAPLNNMLRSS